MYYSLKLNSKELFKTMIKLKVDNTRVMDSIETAHIKVTSPTGRRLCLYKTKLLIATEPQKEAFWKCCGDPMVERVEEIEVTRDEMVLLFEFFKL